MNARSIAVVFGTLGFGFWLAGPALAQEAPAPAAPDDIEVQTRGPVHEAYAEPVADRPVASPIVPKQPPDPIPEMPAEMKPEGDNVLWIPGYWAWDDDRNDFLWVSGFWRVPPPERQWVPGHWDQVDNGWQWTPGFWAEAEQANVDFLPPPPPTIDAGPSTPATVADSVYVPGIWVYRTSGYMWRPGFWLTPRPGWIWVPAHYVWTPAGYVFVDGYWDYPLVNRGLLFSPVYFDAALWQRRGWFYRPSFAVYPDFLFGALFVRPGYGSYYFGDYFDPAYRRRGFEAWMDVRLGRFAYDPLFSYYRWANRDNPTWSGNLRTLYAGRFNGTLERPPQTLAQQNTLIQNISNKSVTVQNIKNVTVVAPVTKFQSTTVKLQQVTPTQVQTFQRQAQAFREASVSRAKVQAQVRAQGPVPVRPTDKPRSAKFELPRSTAPAVKTIKTPPPPRPAAPAHETRPIPKHEPPPPPKVVKPLRPEEKPAPRPAAPKPSAKPAPKQPDRPPSKPPEARQPERPAPRPPERPAPKPPEKPKKDKDK